VDNLYSVLIMDQEQLQKLWKTVVAEIEIDLGKLQTKLFFSRTFLQSLENGVAKIVTPNAPSKSSLEGRYYTLIQNSLERQLKTKVSLVFEVSPVEKKSEDLGPLFSQPAAGNPPSANDPGYLRTHLNPKYKFETLVVGSSNNFAHAAALRICQNPGKDYNPLFIYGGVGIGKTHLMQAIGNEIYRQHPDWRILYTPAELFLNDLVASFRDKSTPAFKKKYRDVDLLLMDDIQFMSSKEAMQEEFFHCFNTLFMNEKQIVLTSDRPPEEIKVEDRLLSRLMGGLAVDIQPPDLEMRMAIIKQKLEMRNQQWADEIVEYLAQHYQSNIREIEGGIQLIIVRALAEKRAIDLEFVRTVIKSNGQEVKETKKGFASPKTVITAVSKITGVKPAEILSDKRNAELVLPRQIAMFILRTESRMGYVEIANALNRKDHTTVIHAERKIKELLTQNSQLNEEVMSIKKEIWG
jgi:chromosomal replication initiator protein